MIRWSPPRHNCAASRFAPLIAAINGVCLAAGTELLLATDIRVAAEHAVFGLPEVTRGLLPFAGSMARLPRQLAWCQAMELLLTGESIDAGEAHRIGLINHVVPAAEVLAKAEALARRIAANGPLAVQAAKRTAIESNGLSLADAYQIEDEAWRTVRASDDAREGPRAFVERPAAAIPAAGSRAGASRARRSAACSRRAR